MLNETLVTDSVSRAVEMIVRYFLNNNSDNYYYERGKDIIYFDGWDGIGASAVLCAIAKLPRSKDVNFDLKIHIDFSMSGSRRALQRIIVEQLMLKENAPSLDKSVMAILDKQDEEDDFNGIENSSRAEIGDVKNHIFQFLRDKRFLVTFLNGSDEEINLVTCGFPLFDMTENKVLWTYQGRFRNRPKPASILKERQETSTYSTGAVQPAPREKLYDHVFLDAQPRGPLSDTAVTTLLREEATELARYARNQAITPEIAVNCWFYLSWLHYNYGNFFLKNSYDNFTKYDQGTHIPSYWVCDGIVGGEGAWEAASNLCEAMRMENFTSKINRSNWFQQFSKLTKNRSRWISMTSEHLETQTIQTIPEEATSYFLTLQNSDLPNNLFPQSSQLRVLKLSSCAFSFTSPPFHWCDNMRFLCIDSCKDNGRSTDELIVKQGESWRFLRRLWVLDIRHTDGSWILIPQMMELMTELRELNIKAVGVSSWNWHMYLAKQKFLHNLHKFRIIECPIQFMDLLRIPLIGMYRLEFLDLSGNKHMEVLPNLSTASGLKVLILDGCDGLRNVESHALPSSLESFSFDGFGPALKWKHLLEIPRKEARPSVRITQKTPIVSKISLNGLALLKNLFLRGLPNLLELNLSETAVQAVNLDDMQLRNLERLSLLGCEMLQRVQWHDTRNPPLKVLQIDTRAKATRSLDHDCQGFQMDNNSSPQAHIVVTDERVLRGFMITHPISNVLQGQKFHLHLSSSVSNKQGSYYNQKESSSSDELSAPQVIESPFSYLGLLSNIAGHDDNDRSVKGCALLPLQCHIEISEGGCNLEIAKDPDRQNIDMLLRYAESLHVHDHSSITTASLDCIKGQFEKTQWCLVERCPKMHTVFHIDKDGNTPQSFMSLQTFKAFQLLEVQCIWSRKVRFYEDSTNRLLAFKKLQCINLYSCPRLKFILPWSFASLPGLETILVTYCGELREIFPKGETHGRDRATSIVFSSLKRIQLEELPRLRQICETVMLAPALETVKLRGCWSLRRLPAIHTGRGNNKPLAVVDCEKDWWDMLRWDGLEESRTLFVPRHSKYHKMRMLRGSPLR